MGVEEISALEEQHKGLLLYRFSTNLHEIRSTSYYQHYTPMIVIPGLHVVDFRSGRNHKFSYEILHK